MTNQSPVVQNTNEETDPPARNQPEHDSSGPQHRGAPITTDEALERIRNIPDPNQALVILAGFWELVPPGRVFELALFELYCELHQRQLATAISPSDPREEANWEREYLSQRIAILAIALKDRFQRESESADLDRSIVCFREAIGILPDDFEEKSTVFINFGSALHLRFEHAGDISDLEESLVWQRKAISLTLADSPLLAQRLRSIGIALRGRFQQLGHLEDLEEAISDIRSAVAIAANIDDPDRSLYVHDLGTVLRRRFDRFGRLEDIEEAIACHKESILHTPDTDSHLPERLSALGMALASRYDHTGHEPDLDEAQIHSERALLITPERSRDKSARLNNLGSILQSRFRLFGTLSDLEATISYHQAAVDLTPDSSVNKSAILRTLAISLSLRFEYLGDLQDIEAAIALLRRALSLTPNNPYVLKNLGSFLVSRSRHTDNLDDLAEAIDVQSQAVSLSSGDDLYAANYFQNLGESFLERYERLDKREDITQAVTCAEKAVQLTPDGHMSKPRRLDFLTTVLSAKFERGGQPEDIEKAVSTSRLVISLTPDGDASRPRWLDSLGNTLAVWFDHTGKLAYLDEGIRYNLEAVSLTRDDHRHKPALLANLGKLLLARFDFLQDAADADRSLSSYQSAMTLTPDNHSGMAALLTGFGNALSLRFKRFKGRSDLEGAIQSYREALALTPANHTVRPARLSNLGGSLMDRNVHFNQHSSVEEAITLYREAVSLTNKDHHRLPFWLNHLGMSLIAQYRQSHNISDLDEALGCLEKSISLARDTEPTKAMWLKNLATAIQLRLDENPDNRSDRIYLLDTLLKSSRIAAGNPEVRISAACDLAYHASRFGLPSLDAYAYALEITPTFIWLGNTIRHRHQSLTRMQALASEAAAEAIKHQRYELAIEWLEQGRSIVWNQILKLRMPVDGLRKVDSALADRLEQVSTGLDQANVESAPTNDADAETATRIQHQLADEWDSLVKRARNLPGFERFLMPHDFQTLTRATHSGAVVIINVHTTGCDALALLPESQSAIHIPLPAFSYQVAAMMRQQWSQCLRASGVRERGVKRVTRVQHGTQMNEILANLWSSLVMPILDHLGYLVPPPTGAELPRVTWCATGPLSFLPLHATGIYGPGSSQKAFRYVVSSYTPTLSALLTNPPPSDQFRGILAVGQAATQGMSALPGTTEELNNIRTVSHGLPLTRLEGSQATHASVLEGMRNHSWVHLACHASQHLDDPTSSAFYLYDQPLDLATISRAPFKNAGFAFLSACQTATGVEQLSEEAVHLAAGMLMSGYPSVIATMWSVRDQDAPAVAEKVYARLLEGGVASTTNVAWALHDAVGYLRDRIGEDNFEAWVPYIHIGL